MGTRRNYSGADVVLPVSARSGTKRPAESRLRSSELGRNEPREEQHWALCSPTVYSLIFPDEAGTGGRRGKRGSRRYLHHRFCLQVCVVSVVTHSPQQKHPTFNLRLKSREAGLDHEYLVSIRLFTIYATNNTPGIWGGTRIRLVRYLCCTFSCISTLCNFIWEGNTLHIAAATVTRYSASEMFCASSSITSSTLASR